MANNGKAQKMRGYRAEVKIAKHLMEHGISAKRVPLSGSLGGELAGDIKVEHGIIKRLEVKHRDNAMKQPRKWLAQGDADALVVDTGAKEEPLVILKLSKFEELLNR